MLHFFLSASLPGTETAHQLVVSIRQKCTPEEVLGVLKDLPNPRSEEEADSRFNPLKIDVFVQTLLNLGSKSFSHSFAAISKFHYVFKVGTDSMNSTVKIKNCFFFILNTNIIFHCRFWRSLKRLKSVF